MDDAKSLSNMYNPSSPNEDMSLCSTPATERAVHSLSSTSLDSYKMFASAQPADDIINPYTNTYLQECNIN